MSNGFWIDNIHSIIDWDIVLNKFNATNPKAKVETIDIPGADGHLDSSTVLTYGDIKYDNRNIKIECTAVSYDSEVDVILDRIRNEVHGQVRKVKYDGDPDFYYIGRCSMSDPKIINNRVATFTITVDAEPYKYKIFPTVKVDEIVDSKVVFYQNLRKWVVPKIKTTGEINVQFEDLSVSLGAGEHTVPDILFKPGENVLKFTGNATVTVTYQEGKL